MRPACGIALGKGLELGGKAFRIIQNKTLALMPGPKIAAPPKVALDTWRALFAVAAEFAALKPWECMYNTNVVGLIDPHTGQTRIASVLGNGGEVFGVAIYRRPTGLRWVLQILANPHEIGDFNGIEGLDALKLEFVHKRELVKADLAAPEAAGFKPKGKGCVWPQFRSAEPGWLPWFIN